MVVLAKVHERVQDCLLSNGKGECDQFVHIIWMIIIGCIIEIKDSVGNQHDNQKSLDKFCHDGILGRRTTLVFPQNREQLLQIHPP